eukprot:NODE_240_length_13260_cov_0.403313.p3 type:complete len:581 gc:universal NODE_240_length_13260_cov_0.403313:11203-9461(-)
MTFFSMISAVELAPKFQVSDISCSAVQPASVKLDCNPVPDDYSIFFESSIAAIDKCRIDVTKDKPLNGELINFIGLLSDRGDGAKSDQLKVKVCSTNGEVPIALPLTVNRNFEQPQATCSSTGDPHITTFSNDYYSDYAVGSAWLVKGDTFDIQVLHEKCYDAASCTTKVGIRYLDNVYVADLANTQFNCHSANKCVNAYGTTIQAGENGGSIVTLPGNVVVTVAKNFALGLDLNVKAPGQDASKYAPSICNPVTKYDATVPVTPAEYNVADNESYFAVNEIALPPHKSAVPIGYNECQLPVTCDDIYPHKTPVATQIPIPASSQVAQAPTETESDLPALPVETGFVPVPPEYGQKTGKKVCTGFKIHKPITYVAPPPNFVLVPPKAQKSTVKPSPKEAHDKCSSVCDADAFKSVDALSDLDFIIKSCESDYAITIVDGVSLAVEAARKQCLSKLQQKTEDVIKTSPDASKAEECKKIQVQHQLGDYECKCGANGSCTAFGCSCKAGYGGEDCSIKYPLPNAVAPTITKISSAPSPNDYKLPTIPSVAPESATSALGANTYSSANTISTMMSIIMMTLIQ